MNSTIKFIPYYKDLPKTSSYWCKDSYEKRKEHINEVIVNKTGFMPWPHRQSVRLLSLSVKESTTIDDLLRVANYFQASVAIECFQISIDTATKTALMLFDFLDAESGESVYLNYTDLMVLSVSVIQFLDLPLPDNYDELAGYFLRYVYSEDNKVLEKWFTNIKYKRLSKRDYLIARSMYHICSRMCMSGKKYNTPSNSKHPKDF